MTERFADVDVAIMAQNPDLATAWRTIAWWQATCDYWHGRAIATLPADDQPPVCPDHREAQHRDNKPPWCDSCGWRHGEPARRYGNGRVVA